MNTGSKQTIDTEDFRFEIYKGRITPDGAFVKTRLAGHAFLPSGRPAYRAKIFTLIDARFFIVAEDDSPGGFKILTRDEVQSREHGKRTFWNVVGDAQAYPDSGVMKLKFDLFGEALYMSLYPSNAGNVLPFELPEEMKGAS